MKNVAIVFSILFLSLSAFAQERNPQRGYQAGNSYAISEIESVNLTNGNLILNIPIASLPAGRGSSSGYTVALKYNSKLWNSAQQSRNDGNPDENGNTSYMRELLSRSDHGGWKLDMGTHQLEVISRWNFEEQAQCTSGNGHNYRENAFRFKVQMQLPDGGVKEFRPYGDGLAYGDGYGKGYFSIDPNGVRHLWSHQDSYPGEPAYCSDTTSQITTSGMHYYTNDGSGIRLFIPYGQNVGVGIVGRWTMYYPDGRVVENLPADDSTVHQRITDRNGNKIFWKEGTLNGEAGYKIEDEVGHFIFFKDNKIIQQGVGGELLETTIQWKNSWIHRSYQATDAMNAPDIYRNAEVFDAVHVVDKIVLPSQSGGLEYRFTYNGSDTQPTYGNFVEGWGHINSVTLPSGAKADYSFPLDAGSAVEVVSSSISRKDLSYDKQYDGTVARVTETWLYNILPMSAGGSVTAPDGSVRHEASDYTASTFKGYPYSSINPDGSKTERIWAQNAAPRVNSSISQATNAYVKTEFTSLTDANGNLTLTAIKDFDYDKNGNLLEIREYDWVPYSSVPRVGSGLYSKPTGLPTSGLVLKRKTSNEYYNPTPIATDSTTNSPNHYANPLSHKLHHVIKSSEIRDENNAIKSRSEFYYDDPNTKGNLTETRVWDSTRGAVSNPLTTGTNGNSISTSTAYNPNGSPAQITDANGILTQITYGDVAGPNGNVTDLYPTQTITAHGTSVARTSAAVYDFYTGLVTTSTDVDNNVSTVMEYDPLGRPEKVRSAAGTALESWTQTEYDDTLRRVIVRSDIETIGDGRKVAVQHYDQLGRVRLSRTLENAATEDPTNEQHGIKIEIRYQIENGYIYQLTSNPFRAASAVQATNEPTMGWTISKAWADGKRSEVETFSGAGLPTTFGGNNTASTGVVVTQVDADCTLTIDQASRQRISRTNALGELKEVWEVGPADQWTETVSFPGYPGIAQGYKTIYNYNVLGKMVHVQQGGQNRFFMYDSLSRLMRIRQPEQEVNTSLNTSGNASNNSWTVGMTYDNNGNVLTATDAKGTTITTTYDELNRAKTTTHSDSTPQVNFYYSEVANSKGRLTRVTSSVSESRYSQFDIAGRLTQSKQITDGQTYTSSYQYNLSGGLIEETYPSGRKVKNEFDSNGDLSRIYGTASPTAIEHTYANSFSYSPDGKIQQLRLGNGLWEAAKFNARLQVTEFSLGLGPTSGGLWKTVNDYGELQANGSVDATKNSGNIAKQTVSFDGLAQPFVQTFQYDQLYRLKEAKETNNGNQTWKQVFGYDRFGNRLTHQKFTGTSQITLDAISHPAIDSSNNRFTPNQGYTFDKNGNVIQDAEGRDFVFNGDNKQTEVRDASTNVIGRYWFDGEGKRIKKETATETTVFVYSGSKLIAEYSTATPPPNPTTRYTVTDQLGSPRVIVDAMGQVVSRRDFLPFGEEISPDGTYRTAAKKYGTNGNVRQQFTGYQKDDETGLDFAEARMYENRHGRFTAVDPLVASGKSGDPQTFNRYTYALNNPIGLTDPSGLQAGKWYEPIDASGNVVRGEYKYIYSGNSTNGYRELATTNRKGQLIGSGEVLDPNYVYRFNPNGPWMPSGGLNMAYLFLSDYDMNGYDVIATDAYEDSSIEHPADGYARGSQMAITPLDVALLFSGFRGARAGGSLFQTEALVTNPVPNRLARVIAGEGPFETLGRAGVDDVFVTAADDIAGLNAGEVSTRLGIQPSESFTIIEFNTPSAGIASPVNRSNPFFVGRGATSGGAREFVIPNGAIPDDATIRVVH